MAEIEQAAAAAIAASLDDDATAPASAGTTPFGGGSGTGSLNSHSGTTPLGGQGMNATPGTAPAPPGLRAISENPDFAEPSAQQSGRRLLPMNRFGGTAGIRSQPQGTCQVLNTFNTFKK